MKIWKQVGFCGLVCWLTLAALAQIAPSLSISPSAGEVEKAVFLIEIDGLEAQSRYEIEFDFAGATVFSTDSESDAAGHIPLRIKSTAGDQPGIYLVRVLRNDSLVAQGEFELTAPSESAAEAQVTVQPQSVAFGRPQAIHIVNLLPSASYSIEIISDANQQLFYRHARKSSSTGEIDFEIFAQAGDTPGAHTIAVYDGAGCLVASGDFIIEEPLARDVQLELRPASVQAGDSVTVQVDGLAAFDAVSAQLLAADGALIDALSARASSDGAASLLFAMPAALAEGSYTITVFVEGDEMTSASLLVGAAPTAAIAEQPAPSEAADIVAIEISPQSAPIGSSHRVQVGGLKAGESLVFEISLAGEIVFTTTQRADADGRAILELLTGDEDPPGEYTVKLLREAGNQSTASFVIIASEYAQSPPEPAPASSTVQGAVQVIQSRLQNGSAQVSFLGTAGSLVEVRVVSAEFDPAASLLAPDATLILANDDSRGSKDASLGPLVLPESGSYTVQVVGAALMMPQAADSGAFQVEIEEVMPAPLLPGETAFALTAESPRRYYWLTLAAGDTVSIGIDSDGALDSLLQLVAPDGGEFAFDDDSGGGLDAEFSNLAIEQSGDYILVVADFDERSGSGLLRLERNPVRQLDEQLVAVTLNDKYARERFVFSAAADELLILNIVKRGGDVADLLVRASIEGMEIMSHSTMGVPDALPLPFVMPMSGQALLTLEKVGVNDGISLDVSLQRPG